MGVAGALRVTGFWLWVGGEPLFAAFLQEVGSDRVLVEGVVAGDDGKAAGSDEVVLAVFGGIVSDDGAFGKMHVAVDDGAADAAVASDVDMREDDTGVDFGVGIDADVLGKDGVAHHAAGDDAAAGDDGVDGHAGASGLAEDEFGRRVLAHARADGPALVVEVEDGGNGGHVHVGVVVGLEGADVAPVKSFLTVLVDEVIGEQLVLAEDGGQDVVSEVVLRFGIFGV